MPIRARQMDEEFDRQVRNLLLKKYPHLLDKTQAAFVELFEPLRAQLQRLPAPQESTEVGRLPFVIVVKSQAVAVGTAMQQVEREGKTGFVNLFPIKPEQFQPIAGIVIPRGPAYLLFDIDRGDETRNVTPQQALLTVFAKHRSPLTIDEGIAIVTHFPEFLQKNHCFSLLASRCGDRRVPALWLSDGQPRLGWCWEGNPHTWIGSASCAARIG